MSRRPRLATTIVLLAFLSGCASLVTGGPLVKKGVPTGTIEVVNSTRGALNAVLISSCGASTYGLNRMNKGERIQPGGVRRFTVSAGCWDVDAGATGVGEARQRMNVAVGGTTRYVIGR